MTDNLRDRTVAGVRITMAATVVTGLIQAGLLIVLAHLLRPYDYGLVAAGLVVIRPAQSILFSGLERAIVLSGSLDHGNVKFIQGFNALIGGFATVAAGVLATFLAVLPNVHEFAPMLFALSPLMLIAGLGVTARAQLRQRLQYGRLAVADLSALAASGIASILAARSGWGAYSLVTGFTVQAVVQTVINIRTSGIGFGLAFSWSAAEPVIRASVGISKTSVLEVLCGNLPSLFIGGNLGPSALGLYNRAYSLIQLPVELLMNSMSRVLFSGFNLVRHDLARLRRGIRTLVEVGAATTVPLCFGMAAAGPSLVTVLLGPRWAGIVGIMPWICVGTSFSMLAHLFASMSEATTRFNERFMVQLATTILTGLALFVGAHWGLAGCSAAFAFGGLVYFAGNVLLTARIVSLHITEVLSWTLPGLACGAVLVVLVTVVRHWLDNSSAYLVLSVEIAACAIGQLLVYAIFWRQTLIDILRFSGLRPAH
jgi:O-antigen/teichoic acid export membrane protein